MQRNKIFDVTSVRPSIVIGPPAKASGVLIDYYNNQIMNINAMVEGEEMMDTVGRGSNIIALSYAFQNSEVKEAVRSSVECPDGVGNLLYLTLPALYAVKQNVSKSVAKKRMTRGTLTEGPAERSDATGAYLSYFLGSTSILILTGRDGVEVVLGGLYDPTLQPDYGGNIFAHDKARLKAHAFYDKYNRLLKPWSLPVTLRAGTLIVFEATFHCYKYGKRKVRCIVSDWIV